MSNNFEDLQKQVAELTARVWRLEQALAQKSEPTKVTAQPVVSASTPSAEPQPIHPPVFATIESPRAEQHTDGSLESRIGSQVFNRVGILAVLIGMAWFLKFAIVNHWIGPLGRVLIGLIAG